MSASRGRRVFPTSCTATTGTAATSPTSARAMGVDAVGESRQLSFVDYDNDGQVDLFVAFRDRPNMLFRNEGARFADVAKAVGVADPRKTVGAVWFDMDEDGDLDLFVANQDGDTNALYRNDGGRIRGRGPRARDGRCRSAVGLRERRTEPGRLRQRRPPRPLRRRVRTECPVAQRGRRPIRRRRGEDGRRGRPPPGGLELGRLRQRRPAGSLRGRVL